jgi:D-3-phosphoglycerate dehydrogenase / 2-oxoglutarate reductase
MGKIKFLIVDEMHESIVPMLEEIGVEGVYKPTITRKEVLKEINDYTGLIVRSKINVDKEILESAINLKIIARAGAGLDLLDIEEINNRGIYIINAPEGNQDALAEHAIGMLLSLFNKINQGDQQIRNYIWDREGNRGIELMGKTVCLIGYGYMGQAFAQRLSSFGCNILAYDKYKKNFANQFVQEVSLEELFEKCDILSLHIPLNYETRGLVNKDFINRFKKNIFIINTSRGPVLKNEHLNDLLESGKVLGAALDVIENEKLHSLSPEEKREFERLIKFKNVILTPHIAGWSVESYIKINQVLVNKLFVYLKNEVNIS